LTQLVQDYPAVLLTVIIPRKALATATPPMSALIFAASWIIQSMGLVLSRLFVVPVILNVFPKALITVMSTKSVSTIAAFGMIPSMEPVLDNLAVPLMLIALPKALSTAISSTSALIFAAFEIIRSVELVLSHLFAASAILNASAKALLTAMSTKSVLTIAAFGAIH
jgi:hypothetical protein